MSVSGVVPVRRNPAPFESSADWEAVRCGGGGGGGGGLPDGCSCVLLDFDGEAKLLTRLTAGFEMELGSL